MAKIYELRKVWGFGPLKFRKEIGSFESEYVAKHIMLLKLKRAKRKGKRLRLEVVNLTTGQIIHKGRSK